MMDKSLILKYYKRKDIQAEMIEHCSNKEVGVRYDETFGKRPEVLIYPKEIIDFAVKGVTSFHCSEERWKNPLDLTSNSSKKELDQLRTGWDLVLDIDCKVLEYSKLCANLIVQFLASCGVKNYSCKFSGNKGFHIGVPFEAFPQKVSGKLTAELFPEAPKKIAYYIKEKIKEELTKEILSLEKNDLAKIKEKVSLSQEEIIKQEKDRLGNLIPRLEISSFLEIDTILIASRHLYRAPYSLHEKSGLVSLPLEPSQILDFDKSWTEPGKVVVQKFKFLDRKVEPESARTLLIQALDFKVKAREELPSSSLNYDEMKIESPIQENFFPPCIRKILQGLADGRKRSVFVLANFLGKVGWTKKEIELFLVKWNKEKNNELLRENYIKGQLRYFKPGERLPPNCNNEAYYKGIGICFPDTLCSKIKNPVNYTLRKFSLSKRRIKAGGKPPKDQTNTACIN